MRIAHVFPTDMSAKERYFGGAENNICRLALLQRSDIHSICLVVLANYKPSESFFQYLKSKWPKLSFEIVTIGDYRSPLAWLKTRRVLIRLEPDIVHTHLLPSNICVKLGLIGNHTPIVSTIHNNEPFISRLKWRIIFRLFTLSCDHYICISNAVSHHMSKHLQPKPISTIPYGYVPINQSEPQRLNKQKQSEGKFIIGVAGRLTHQKGIDRLLNAVQVLQERKEPVELVIAGEGELRSSLEHKVSSLPQPTSVKFLGHTPQMEDFYRAIDLFVLPSRWEGLGMVLLEAMDFHVPVLASKAGAIPNVLNHGEYGYLMTAPDNPVALANDILTVCANWEKALSRAKQAKSTLSYRYNEAKELSDIFNVYESVLKQ